MPVTGNPVLEDLKTNMYELSLKDGTAYVKALNGLAPTDSQVAMRTATDINNLIGRQIEARQDMQGMRGMSGGDMFRKVGVWAEGLFNYSKQDQTGANTGFTGKIAGVTIGVDAQYNDATTLGFSYTYNRTSVDNDARDITIDGNTFSLYGKYQPAAWYVRAIGQYGFARYDEKADMVGRVNGANYHVDHYGVSAYAGYDLPNGFTPEFGMRYMYVSQETYVDDLGQRVNADHNDILTAVGGLKYTNTFKDGNGVLWSPKARMAFSYDLLSDNAVADVGIANIHYEVDGKRLDRFGFEAGVGIQADVRAWNFSLGYDLGLRQDYVSHTALFRAKYNF